MHRPLSFAAALALSAFAPAFAQGPPEAPDVRLSAADLKQAFFALQDEFDEANEAYRAQLGELSRQRRENPDAVVERPTPPQAGFYARFAALADGGSAEASLWVLQNHSFSGLAGEAARVDKRTRFLRLLASTPSDEVLGGLVRVASGDAAGRGALAREEALAFLDLIVGCATDPEVQASAALSRAGALDVRGGSRDERLPAITALKSVEARWPATKAGKRAGGQAFAFENLNIGQISPEIVGADVDGNPMKLSDFAGKVVVLDFWGFW